MAGEEGEVEEKRAQRQQGTIATTAKLLVLLTNYHNSSPSTTPARTHPPAPHPPTTAKTTIPPTHHQCSSAPSSHPKVKIYAMPGEQPLEWKESRRYFRPNGLVLLLPASKVLSQQAQAAPVTVWEPALEILSRGTQLSWATALHIARYCTTLLF